jgi:acetyl-CoA synthetase
MHRTKTIIKKLDYEPNLADYQKTYRTFKVEDYRRELTWFAHGKLNAAYNAITRHALGKRRNKIALYWQSEQGEAKKYTFAELEKLSNQFGNLLKQLGVASGERVFFFLPRLPELYFGFLGTLKIGAIAGTLFSAFGPQALLDRLENSAAKVLVTNKELFPRVKKVWAQLPDLEKIILVDADEEKNSVLSFWKHLVQAKPKLTVKPMDPKAAAFMLYTSGTTGKPKGVIHTHQAILHEHLTAKWVLDIRDRDVYWCTADPGWVTGIAYEILGTWSNGASTLVYEGRFDPATWYRLIQDYQVNVWYTAPTAIRLLAAAGLDLVRKYDLSSLRHLASVGEPLNPEAVYWGLKAFGLPFHDNFWQTETGGIVIANYPCLPIKAGSMGKPVPGIVAGIVDDKGKALPPGKEGNLALRPGWPSMMKRIWRRPKKYASYFIGSPRRPQTTWYLTGDRAYQDRAGYFWFIGRADDVIKTSGERVGPFEVESALVAHPKVIEAGVIGKPDPVRGEIIKAFVVLNPGEKGSNKLIEELQQYVKKQLAGHAYPREIEFIDKLPKTRSGKIVRRILKAKELGQEIGDTSTLEEF